MISVIIPVYNEAGTIAEIVSRVAAVGVAKEIIIVNDGSTDGTSGVIRTIRHPGVKVIEHDRNYGKGRAIRTGIGAVSGDIVIIQDADLEYDPRDYPALVEPILSGRAQVVYGYRCHAFKLKERLFNLFLVGRWVLTKLTCVLYGIRITDEPCGYKVFKTDVIKSIPLVSDRFGFCPEVTAKLTRRGFKIHEVPITYNPRTISEGKKITYRDGLEAIEILFKYRYWR